MKGIIYNFIIIFNTCCFATIMWNFRQKSLQQFNLIKHSINYILSHKNLLVFSTSFHCGTDCLYWVITTGSTGSSKQVRGQILSYLNSVQNDWDWKIFQTCLVTFVLLPKTFSLVSWDIFLIIALRRQSMWSVIPHHPPNSLYWLIQYTVHIDIGGVLTQKITQICPV